MPMALELGQKQGGMARFHVLQKITSVCDTPLAMFLSLHSKGLNRAFLSKMLPGPELRGRIFNKENDP